VVGRSLTGVKGAIAPDSTHRVFGMFAGALFLTCLPILLTPLPPLNDYPQHIARVYILANRDQSQFLTEYYAPDWAFQANLAIEAVMLPMAKFLPVQSVGRIFLFLILLVTSSGVLALHRVTHRRWSIWPLLVFFVLYNRVFLGGIIAYLFTLGLTMWMLALWIAMRDRRVLLRATISTALALLVMLGHLGAFAVYAFSVAGYESWRHLSGPRHWYALSIRDLLATLPQVVVPTIVFLLASKTSGNAGGFRYDFLQKLTAPLNLFYDYHLIFDAVCFIALLIFALLGLLNGWIRICPPLLGSVVALIIAYFAVPYVMFGSHGADRRLTVAIALVAIAATDWSPATVPKRRAIVMALALLLSIRIAIVFYTWHADQSVYRQYLAAIDTLPQGGRLGVLYAHDSSETLDDPPVQFVAQYAIICRQAFVATTFTMPGEQPLRFRPPYDTIAKRSPSVYGPAELRRLWASRSSSDEPFQWSTLSYYDYVLVIGGQSFHREPPDWIKPTFAGEGFTLYKVAQRQG
jgi:hypothetical protein